MLQRLLAVFLSFSFLIDSLPAFAAKPGERMRLELTDNWRQAADGLGFLSQLPPAAVESTFGPIVDELAAVYRPDQFTRQALISMPDEGVALMEHQIRIALSKIDANAVDAAIKEAVYARIAKLDAGGAAQQIPEILKLTDAAGLLYKSAYAQDASRNLRKIQAESRADQLADAIARFKTVTAISAALEEIPMAAVAADPAKTAATPILLARPEPGRPDSPRALIDSILGPEIEAAAADAHNVGWKKAKDEALADPNDPFVGWAPKRIRVSAEIRAMSKETVENMVGKSISDEKFRAIQAGRDGQDITHTLYKPYEEMLLDQTDGGTRVAGQNAAPLMTLALYLADFRASDIRTWEGMKRVLRGLADGSDHEGIAELSRQMHQVFQGMQLNYGERGYPGQIVQMQRTGETMPVHARGDFKPYGALHKTVQELDGYTLLPAAKWLLERIESLYEHEHEPHEFFRLLSMGPKEIESLRVLQGSQQIAELRARQKEFRAALAETTAKIDTIKKGDKNKTDKAKNIRAELWGLIDRFGVDKLGPEELASVFYAFKNASLFEDMAGLYEKSNNEAFQRSQVIAELYAVALHKSGSIDESEAAIRRLLSRGQASSETAAILGKVYKLRYQDLRKKDRAAALAALDRSVAALEEGFLLDYYYYPGINLVYNLFTQGIELNDPSKLERARWIAELVHIAARKAGGERSSNYWVIGTLLEASVILGRDKDIDSALPRVLEAAQVDWEIDATLGTLRRLRAQLQMTRAARALPDREAQLARFKKVIDALKTRKAELSTGSSARASIATIADAAPREADLKAARLFDVGTYFGEISSNFAPGTIEYGGQMHSQIVNGWDLAVGRELLRHLGLLDEAKGLSWDQEVDRFNERLDLEIRSRLGTDKLQHSMSAEHHELDEDAKSLNDVMAVSKGEDSRTNIMVDFFLGRVGETADEKDHGKLDCRPHARLKQLLFDIWKAERANAALDAAFKAKTAGDAAAYEAATGRADRIARTFMLTFNSKVESQLIQIRGHQYGILMRRDDKGVMNPVLTPLKNASPFMEAHTWNGIVHLDEKGALARFTLADSFYHWPYQLGGKDQKGRYGIDVPIEDISPDGSILVRQAIHAYEPAAAHTVAVDAALTPAAWSVKGQEKQVRAVFDELGQPRFRGILVGGLPRGIDGRPDISGFFDPSVSGALAKFAARVRKESAVAVRESLKQALDRLDGLDTVADLPPALEEWRSQLEWLARQNGIPATEDNMRAIMAMLKVAPVNDGEASDLPFGRHQIVVKQGTDPKDRFGFAAVLVATDARPYIDRHRPYIKHWKIADRLTRQALQRADPDKAVSEEDVENVLDLLDIATIARGRGHYALQLAN